MTMCAGAQVHVRMCMCMCMCADLGGEAELRGRRRGGGEEQPEVERAREELVQEQAELLDPMADNTEHTDGEWTELATALDGDLSRASGSYGVVWAGDAVRTELLRSLRLEAVRPGSVASTVCGSFACDAAVTHGESWTTAILQLLCLGGWGDSATRCGRP